MAQYSNETKDLILNRMLTQSRSDIDKRQGSVTYDLLSPAALEFELSYSELDNVLKYGFADTTFGDYLDLRAKELGLERKEATKATGSVTFTSSDVYTVKAGTRLATDTVNPVYFITKEEVIINGSVSAEVESEEAGAKGNVGPGEISLILDYLSGVVSVSNADPTEGGTDIESDEALLKRYYDRVRNPATSGNANQYLQWALEQPGVGDAKVYPLWNGNGTVKLVLLNEDMTVPTQTIIDDVSTYIEGVRPVGATVTVAGATALNIDVTATLTLVDGATLTQAQAEIEEKLIEYLKDIAFVDPYIVRYSRIANLILDAPSVMDYSNLTVNGGVANIDVPEEYVAISGTVTLS